MLIALAYAAEGASPPNSWLSNPIFMFAIIFAIFYFLWINPQKKKQKEHQARLNAMKKGDKVISAGGIHGVIEQVNEKSVIVKVADNTKIKFQKSSISVVEAE